MESPTPGPDASPDAVPAPPPIAPAVVAVVVARDPGPWFEETMSAIASQDYPNLSVLVIDAASAEEIKPRVGASAPGAFVRRLDQNPGFGAAANEVLDVVEGAAFYLVCHDDIAPEPNVVRLLVEEAFRSNAAIVGPKLVRWDDPRRLLQLGEATDRVAHTVPLVERDELDQAQHDSVGDVFTVPGACTLVRADLFAEIGGFDEGIDFLIDDVSLCWRARIAGGRVIIAPDARVRHLEALGARRPVDDRRRLQARHRLRVVLSCYGWLSLVRAVPRVAVLNVVEVVYAVVVGRTGQARDVAGSWVWNLRRLGEIAAARRQVQAFRQMPDREIRSAMVPGSARLSQFVRGQIGTGDDRLTGWARTGRGVAGSLRGGSFRFAAFAWGAVALVLLAGSRHLLTRGLPAVGEMVAFSSSPVDLLRSWASAWRTSGLGSESPAPTAFGLLGSAGILMVGAMGLLRTILTLGLIPLGAVGAYRLVAPTGSRNAQIASLLVYVANPLPYNALADGRWGALALYAAAPFMVGMLGRASGLEPFATAATAARPGRRRAQVLGLGIVTALLAALVPVGVVLLVVMAAALALGSLLVYRLAGAGRMLLVALAAAAVAIVLHLPWSIDLLLPGRASSVLVGAQSTAQGSDLAALLRFEVGQLGSAPVGWALLAAPALPLFIARDERHGWAVRGWTMAIVFWGLAWAAQRGDLGITLPPAEVFLAPAAVGLSLAAAMGVVAFEIDLPGYRFGWRQMASGLAAAAVVVAVVPVLGEAFDGRWSMPAGDHARVLAFVDAENDDVPFRVLWVGDPAVLPLGSWELTEGVGYATTDRGTPRPQDLWAGSDDGRTRLIADVLDLARTGQTARLGRLLAPMGVRYVVVPERLAPAPFATEELPLPRSFSATLAGQLDLEPLDIPAGLTVYRNEAFAPTRAQLPAGVVIPEGGGITAAADVDLSTAALVLPEEAGHLEWTGPLDADAAVLFSASHSDRWELAVEGEVAEHAKPFGWANGFQARAGGDATLRFRAPLLHYGVLALQVVLWLGAVRALLRARLGAGTAVGAST